MLKCPPWFQQGTMFLFSPCLTLHDGSCYLYRTSLVICTWRVLLFVQDESCYLYRTSLVICTGRVLLFVQDGSCYLYRTGLAICTWRVLLFVQDKKSWSSYTFYDSFDFLMFVFEFRFVFSLLLLCIQVESSKYPPNSTGDMLDLIIAYTTNFVATTIGRCSPKFHIQQAL